MIEYEIKPEKKISLGLGELWNYRELFYFFTWRDIKVKYKQTALGFAWAVLQPLLMMLVFSFFFGKTLKVPSENIPYPVFVFSGLLLWNIFSAGLSNAGNSMVANANIIKKIYFPRLIIPLSSVLVALFDFIMAFIVYGGVLIYYRFTFDAIKFLIFFPLSLLLCIIATFGTGTFLAALNVKYRDVRYVIPFLIQALLFITPVIYPVSIFNNPLAKFIMALNPITGAIVLFRSALTDQAPDWNIIIIGICSATVLLVTGLYYFRKTEAYFADLA
jgi:homopolymeric O-antigen transport system permease protein